MSESFPNHARPTRRPPVILSPHHEYVLHPLANGAWRVSPTSNVIAAGRYKAIVLSAAAIEETKTGPALHLRWKLLGTGRHAGRVVDQFIDYAHPNSKVMAIAQAHLKNICDAAGIVGLMDDSKQLLGTKAIIKTALVGDESYVVEVVGGAAAFGGVR